MCGLAGGESHSAEGEAERTDDSERETINESESVQKDECETNAEEDSCSNPFKIHSKPIYKGLRVIIEGDKKRHATVVVGQLWCDTCRKVMPVKLSGAMSRDGKGREGQVILFSLKSGILSCSDHVIFLIYIVFCIFSRL